MSDFWLALLIGGPFAFGLGVLGSFLRRPVYKSSSRRPD